MKQTIVLMFTVGPRSIPDAHVFGNWAAHPKMDFDPNDTHKMNRSDGWRVSHLPSGLAISSLVDELDEAEAVAIARRLGDAYPLDADRVDRDDVTGLPSDAGYIIQALVAEALDEIGALA